MRHRGRFGSNLMGNEQFNSYRSGNYSSRYTNEYSPTRNAYNRGEHIGKHDYGANYGNSEYYANKDRNDDSGFGSRNQGSYGSSSYNRNRDYDRNQGHDRDWSDRAGDEVRSWFGDDDAERRRRRDDRHDSGHDSWFDRDRNRSTDSRRSVSNQYIPSTRTSRDDNYDRDNTYDNSRNLRSGRYESSDDNYTGYGRNRNTDDRSAYGNVYGTSYGRDLDTDDNRYGSNRYGSSGSRTDRNRSWNDDDERGFLDKAGDEVRSWFGDDEAERRRRMDDLRDYNDDRYRDRDRDDSRRSHATYTSGPPYSYGSASRRDYEW